MSEDLLLNGDSVQDPPFGASRHELYEHSRISLAATEYSPSVSSEPHAIVEGEQKFLLWLAHSLRPNSYEN
jgi:hypothetical protein